MSYETAITIKEVISCIKKKKYVLPSIQRGFVWRTSQIETLFDSLMRDYPIGTFLFWRVDKDKIKDFDFYEFLGKYHEKNNCHNKKSELSNDEDIIALLDGQQRMTSLYLALCGSYSNKKKHARKSDLSSYQEKYLYLNLLQPSSDTEMEYDFKFLTKKDAQEKSGFWFDCTEILNFSDMEEVYDFLEENDLSDTAKYEKTVTKYIRNTLCKLFRVIHEDKVISYYLEKGEELDKVLQIFIRINSGGTKLSYSDLLLSISTAQWEEKDARNVIHDFVDEINAIGDGFSFNKDIVLKSCLVLSDLDVKFKVDNFTKENMSLIEKNWEGITLSLRSAIGLLSNLGYNQDSLLATNAIIPIAYFIYSNEYSGSILQSSHREEDRRAIKEWLARVLLKGTFGGQPDSIYPAMRELIKAHMGRFPLQEIIVHYKGGRKTLIFTEDEIDGVLDLQYGKAKTYCALTMLYPSLNYNSKYHQDHIHAKSLFTKSRLRDEGLNEGEIDEYISEYNGLSNLQLLEATQNIEKSSKLFDEWIIQRFNNKDERSNFLTQNYIGLDQDLKLSAFLEFIKQRKLKLKSTLLQLLGVQ